MTSRAVATALFGVVLGLAPLAARAACTPAGSSQPDDIVCSGTDEQGVRAGAGDDRVTVTRGAIVSVQVPGTATAPVAIDAGSGNDNVLNQGTVTVRFTAGGTVAANAGGCPAWSPDTSTARGLHGATGADTLGNLGTVTVSSLFQATGAATALSATFCAVPLGALATGLDGGDSSDRFTNGGTLTVSATVEAAPAAGTAGTAYHGNPPHGPTPPAARAIGIAGGDGDDAIANDGTVIVTATTSVEGGEAHATGAVGGSSGSSVVNRGTMNVTATANEAGPAIARGIGGGNGRDVIENLGTIIVNATAQQESLTAVLTLLGGDAVTSTTLLEARAVGIDAGDGKDRVVNGGTVNVTATSTILSVGLEHNVVDTSHSDTTTTIRSTAIGIDAGGSHHGVDIRNSGTIDAQATSRSTSVAVEVNRADAATADSEVTIEASATGIAGGRGRDTIENSGTISATAKAELVEVGVNASFVDVTIADRPPSNVSTTLNATATGIDAARGKDDLSISHGGSVQAVATADVTSIGVSLASEGVPRSTQTLFEDGGLASIGVTATGEARGIVGGSGKDRLASGGDITALATADTLQASINVGVGIFDFKLPTPGLVLGSAGTGSVATASGIDTGSGSDEIATSGKVTAGANATAAATTVSVNIAELSVDFLPGVPGLPLGASLTVADTTTEAEATANGVLAGDGDDRVTNTGSVAANAHAESGSTSVAATLNIKHKDNLFTLNAVGARAETIATANAVGIDGGAGRDDLRNHADVTVGATADAHAVAVGVDVAGTVQGKGGAISIALNDTSSEATAGATGIHGGRDDDSIVNTGTLAVTASTGVDSVSVSSTIGIAKEGLVAGAALARAETSANSTAVGIDGGEGNNQIANHGAISAKADADTDSVAVALAIAGTTKGVEGGVALVDAGATATATATGIRTSSAPADTAQDRSGGHDGCHGCPDDNPVVNTGAIDVDADANTDAVGVGAKIGVAKEGAAVGVALADTSSTSTANATGIEADARADVIVNAGSIGLRSVADADAVSVTVTLEGTATGLAAGAALADASVAATARATGVAAGSGDDVVVNTGAIVASEVESTATAVGVALSALIAKEGAALGAALGRTSATATTLATGIDGGAGADRLYNEGDVTLANVKANSDAVTVALEIALAKEGLAVGAALADSTSTAQVTARGLDGATGDDLLVNDGRVTLQQVVADANAVSVSVTLAGAKDGVAIGAALVDAGATATAGATGLAGGDGRDTLANYGLITLDDIRASADATGVSAGFTFAKEGLSIAAALARTGAAARNDTTGMQGGGGNDALFNEAQVTLSNVRAEAGAVSVTAGLAGANDGVAISAALADATGTAETTARAMDGGEGDDLLVNRGRLAAGNITARGDAASITVQLAGANAGVAAGVTLADTSAIARTETKGIDGGAGNDELWNKGRIEVGQVRADAVSVGVGVSLNAAMNGVAAGAALGRAQSAADATVAGMDGGTGDDWLANKGTITVDGVTANTDAVRVSAQLGVTSAGVAIGAALVDSSATARTGASGLHGGTGNDTLVNDGAVTLRNIEADANAVGVAVTLNAAVSGGVAAGVALTDGSGTAEVRAVGLGGGDGNDTLVNTGSVRTENVQSNAHATGVSVSLQASMAGLAVGAAIADTRGTATTRVAGLDGGAGDDVLYNAGAVDVQGKANSNALSIAVNITGAVGVSGGAAITDASSTASAAVTGIDGGAGRDEIFNEGSVRAKSEAAATSTSISVGIKAGVGGDVTLADARSTATAVATGIHDIGMQDEPCKPRPHASGLDVAAQSGGHGGGDDCRDDKHGHGHDETTVIANRGSVGAEATATSHGTGISANLSGFALGETTNTSTATATGIRLEDSRDVVRNEGAVTATSSATAEGLAVAVSLIGHSAGDATSTATATAVGIDTGTKDDQIENLAALTVDARSNASALSVSVGLIGASTADASITSSATAVGIDGGEGDDKVRNASSITVAAGLPDLRDGSGNCTAAAGGACAQASTVNVQLAGSGTADAATTANAAASGIDGGSGNDAIDNDGSLAATALARARSGGTGVTIFGGAGASASSTASATAAALLGGDGRDHIVNRGSLDVHAAGETSTGAVAFTLVGSASSEGNTITNAQATGIGGGNDGDAIANVSSGSITVRATTASSVAGTAWTFAGGAAAEATLGAFTSASGITGGSGADLIYNGGGVEVDTNAYLDVTGNRSTAIFGGARAGSRLTADALATGIDGGDHDDAIRNTGRVDAGANATLTSRTTSFSFVGGAATAEVLLAAATASGITGGSGNNALFNEGSVSATASAQLTANGGASSTFGDAEVVATVAARTAATGLSAAAGDDTLVNDSTGSVTVTVTASPTADNDSAGGALFVDGVTRSAAWSTSTATGLDAGAGDNFVLNKGSVTVTLGGTTQALGLSDPVAIASYLGINTDAFAFAETSLGATSATGIVTGAGRDRVTNLGSLDVSVTPTAYARANAQGDAIANGYGTSGATAHADQVQATGIDAGDGENVVYNGGTITVTARPVADGNSISDADGLGVFSEPDSHSSTVISANGTRATGIRAGTGENTIVNEGALSITASPQADRAEADADHGGDVLGIDALANATADANNTSATGIHAEGTRNVVLNRKDGTIDVTASPYAVADVYANGVGRDGDAHVVSTANANAAQAVGILAVNGENQVVNDGTIRVTTDSAARSLLFASPSSSGEIEDFLDDATARDANAIGIWADGAANEVANNGSIEVGAKAAADIQTQFGRARTQGLAVGIRAGHGASRIENNGELRVAATAVSDPVFKLGDVGFGSSEASALAIGIEAGNGGNRLLNTGVIRADATATGNTLAAARAVGIQTGSGDDTIINRGTISATQTVNGVTTNGVAIDAGAGNDQVILGDGSVTTGLIDLGSGSNTLSLEGTPVINGGFIDGESSLTLQFLNDGNYGGALPGVAAVKDGIGTFTLSMLNPMQRLEVRQGTLHLTRAYSFLAEGSFLATVHGDGTHGQFRIGGLAQLAGGFTLQRGNGAFRDGTTYDVLFAEGGIAAGSAFERIELPDATRLLGFSMQQLADSIRIRAGVQSFTTVAMSANQGSLARNFDRVLPGVTGDLNAALGTIQTLTSDADFATAFSSLSPAAHAHPTRASLSGARQYGQTLQDRMTALQVAEVPASAGEPVRLSLGGGTAGLHQLSPSQERAAAAHGVWMKGFAQRGEQDAQDGFNGYEHSLAGLALGIDRRFGASFLAGLSFGRASNSVKAEIDRSDADITSRLFALYGSWFDQPLYVNGTLASGRNEYDTRRAIVVGPTVTPVASRHRGDVLAASLGAGTLLRAGQSWLDPFANLQYTRLKEDGFREEGSGAGLVVGERTTRALVSTAGLRWFRVFGAAGDATWTPEASVAWLHDFDRGGHVINAAYVDAPDATFSIAGQPVEKNGAVLGLGVTYRSTRGLATFLRYKGELRDGYAAHGVIGELRYEF